MENRRFFDIGKNSFFLDINTIIFGKKYENKINKLYSGSNTSKQDTNNILLICIVTLMILYIL